MNKEYYIGYYEYERSHWWFLNRSKIIENIARKNVFRDTPLRILNIGVATGASTQMLEKYGTVVSVEYDKDCFEFVSGVLKGTVLNASITELPFEADAFDLVCAFDVIEHVEDHQLAVNEMYRVCKPGGHVYVTVPAYMSLWSKHDVINHHVRRYTRKNLTALFTELRGRKITSTYFNSLLFPPIYLFRVISTLIRPPRAAEQESSDFDVIQSKSIAGKLINAILGGIFSIEVVLLKFLRFPAGVSILFLFRKNDQQK